MLFKNGSETPTLTIAAPVMTDSNGAISDAVTLSLVDDILTVSADEEWIQAPERAYPIKIDPNFTVTSGKIDVATVSEHHGRYAAKAYGYVGDLTANQIGVPGAKDLGRTRMYFAINDDFSSIPEGSKINSASLRIKDIFKDTPPLTAYDSDLTDQAVSGIQLKENGTISLVLINGQRIGKEKSA